jgi:hypothetical protein
VGPRSRATGICHRPCAWLNTRGDR